MTSSNDTLARLAQVIEDRTRHLAWLVEQILDVSRLGAARMQLSREDTELMERVYERGLDPISASEKLFREV